MLNKLLLKLSVPLFLFFLFIGAVSSSRVAYAVVGDNCGTPDGFCGTGTGGAGTCGRGESCKTDENNVYKCFADPTCICANSDIPGAVGGAGCLDGYSCPGAPGGLGAHVGLCEIASTNTDYCTPDFYVSKCASLPGGLCPCNTTGTPSADTGLDCPQYTACTRHVGAYNNVSYSCDLLTRCGAGVVGACPAFGGTNCDVSTAAPYPKYSSCARNCGCAANSQECVVTGQNMGGFTTECRDVVSCHPAACGNAGTSCTSVGGFSNECCSGLCSPNTGKCLSCAPDGMLLTGSPSTVGSKCCSGSCTGSPICTCDAQNDCAHATQGCSLTGDHGLPICCSPDLTCITNGGFTGTCGYSSTPLPGICKGQNVRCTPGSDPSNRDGCCSGLSCLHYPGSADPLEFKCDSEVNWTLPNDVSYSGPIIDFTQLIKLIYNILLPVGVAIALFIIAKSGYDIMMSEGNPAKVAESKENLTSSIIGAIFTLLSVAILRLIIVSFIGAF